MEEKMPLTIVYTKDSRPYDAMVHPDCPAEVVLRGLQSPATGPFLPPAPQGRPYVLSVVKTGQELSPSTTMKQAGVATGDTLEVSDTVMGAGGAASSREVEGDAS